MYREVDWIMGEKGNLGAILEAKAMVGEDTELITCMALWNRADPTTAVPQALEAGVGLYGFAKPAHNRKGIIPLDRILPKKLSELNGDARSIAVLARAYHGKSIDSVWTGEGFVETDPSASSSDPEEAGRMPLTLRTRRADRSSPSTTPASPTAAD